VATAVLGRATKGTGRLALNQLARCVFLQEAFRCDISEEGTAPGQHVLSCPPISKTAGPQMGSTSDRTWARTLDQRGNLQLIAITFGLKELQNVLQHVLCCPSKRKRDKASCCLPSRTELADKTILSPHRGMLGDLQLIAILIGREEFQKATRVVLPQTKKRYCIMWQTFKN
jgi:hypothetical protein